MATTKCKVSYATEEHGKLTFTISGIDVSYINGIRRVILSDIPIVGIRTTPHEKCQANIVTNTSRLNNEIVKQRLSCIPICINYLEEEDEHHRVFEKYRLEIDVENTTDTMLVVTTEHFQLIHTETNQPLERAEVKKIFPPFIAPNGVEYYIDFLRLRPKLSDEIRGEKIKLSATFSVVSAREDSSFNVTGTCSYGFTPDLEEMDKQLKIRQLNWETEGKTGEEIEFEAKNWKLLEGLRYVVKNSFDFTLESVGIYRNSQLWKQACLILLTKMESFVQALNQDDIEIVPSDNTMVNCYDITLENEDYTFGNILNHEIYTTFYMDLKTVNYVGFKKVHPHDTSSILRIGLANPTEAVSTVKTILHEAIGRSVATLADLQRVVI